MSFTVDSRDIRTGEVIVYTIVLLSLFAMSYYDVFQWMLGRYLSEDSYYSHGFLIPFVSAYLVWLKREELGNLERKGSTFGLALVLLAIITHFFATIVYIFSLSGFSVWLLIVGISFFLYGKEMTRAIIFPLVFLLFMFPLPSAIISIISFPLKMLVAQAGVKVASLLGVPLLSEGFVITIPQGDLLVGNPCSGLRSLIAFLAIGLLFSYFSNLSRNRQTLLFLVTIPIAVLSNLVRVPILIVWSYNFGLESAAPGTLVHTGSGVVVFLSGLLLIYAALRLLGGTCEN